MRHGSDKLLEARYTYHPTRHKLSGRSDQPPIHAVTDCRAPLVQHQLLRYVSGMKDQGLLYRHSVTKQLVGYTNANWSGDASDR